MSLCYKMLLIVAICVLIVWGCSGEDVVDDRDAKMIDATLYYALQLLVDDGGGAAEEDSAIGRILVELHLPLQAESGYYLSERGATVRNTDLMEGKILFVEEWDSPFHISLPDTHRLPRVEFKGGVVSWAGNGKLVIVNEETLARVGDRVFRNKNGTWVATTSGSH